MSLVKESKSDRIFNFFNCSVLFILMLLVAYPLYFVIIASFSDPYAVTRGEVWLIPKNITFEGYEKVFANDNLWRAYWNSLKYMLIGTTINVSLTICAGYSLSRKDLKGSKIIMLSLVFTMFFQGGMIPTYLLVKNLGLLDTVWALVLPNAVSVMNILICKTYFSSNIPDSLLEAAQLDGCSDFKFFLNFVLPLSGTIIMVMILFYAVGHWNAYIDALIYLRKPENYPLQITLRDILMINEAGAADMMLNDDSLAKQQRIAALIKYCVIVFANLPLLALYPFVKKYFKKGVMIGAIKG